MPIRPAVYDRDAAENPDAALALRLLRGTKNPPNETEESVGAYFNEPNSYGYVDEERQTVIRMVVDLVSDLESWDQQIVIPWWMTDGDVRGNMIPTIAACARKVLTDWPQAADWPCWGSFPGDPALEPIDRAVESEAEAESYRVVFPDIVVEPQPGIPGLFRARSTLRVVTETAEAVRVPRRD